MPFRAPLASPKPRMIPSLPARYSARQRPRASLPSEAVVPGKQAGRSLSGKAIAGDGWRIGRSGRLRCRRSGRALGYAGRAKAIVGAWSPVGRDSAAAARCGVR
jgi:hypothetical protein